MATRLTTLDMQTPAIDTKAGVFTGRWQELMRLLFGDVASFTSQAAIIDSKTIAQANALGLGAGDAGYLVRITDGFNHVVRWDGSAWRWGPGDLGNGRLEFFAVTPDADMWAACDGSGTTYLTGIGTATLAASAFTTPNPGSDRFLKTGTYTGSNVAAVAPAVSGVLDNESGHTHATGSQRAGAIDTGADFESRPTDGHVHSNPEGGNTGANIGSSDAPDTGHTHPISFTTAAGSAHTHGLGTLAVDSASRPPTLAAVLYFRR